MVKGEHNIVEAWQSGLMRRSCPPEADPPLAEKPLSRDEGCAGYMY